MPAEMEPESTDKLCNKSHADLQHMIPRIHLLSSFLDCVPNFGSILCYHLISSIFSLSKKKKKKSHDKRVVTSVRRAVKTSTLWSLLPWAVCFVKHFFTQCQAGITKCDNQMQIICMHKAE